MTADMDLPAVTASCSRERPDAVRRPRSRAPENVRAIGDSLKTRTPGTRRPSLIARVLGAHHQEGPILRATRRRKIPLAVRRARPARRPLTASSPCSVAVPIVAPVIRYACHGTPEQLPRKCHPVVLLHERAKARRIGAGTVVLMHISATKRLGSVPGQAPGNKGRRYPPEPLTPDEVAAIIGQCSVRARTGVRNRALLT